jgi:hypothetical protein
VSVTRIIFEKGIEVGSGRNSLKRADDGSTFAEMFAQIWERYKVRPILLTETIPTFGGSPRERHTVLTLNGRKQLNVLVSSLQLPQGLPEKNYVSLLRATMNIQYVAAALVYHCQELALLYSQICDTAIRLSQELPIEGNGFTLQDQSDSYHEFDALITAARRTYDALRYILWPVFGSAGSQTPRNFPKTIEACNRLPEMLRDILSRSWSSHGEKLTDYRDCIQHYVPVTFGIETAWLQKLDGGTWSVLLRIPDNPEARSQRKFRFAGGLDALTYGWELANELIGVAAEILGAIPGEARQMGRAEEPGDGDA